MSTNTGYSAEGVESKWYAAWEAAGLFQPNPDSNKPLYSITIPPPNITGSLHMGHALCYPLQDLLGRYKRLKGHRVLILPGQDHAGIATQTVVDRQLRKEGLSAFKVGREKFVERVWDWRKESGDTILHQFRSLGCAFDWSRQRFTLDDDYAQAVLDVFISWYERGLIYRGLRVVNWDSTLRTSVSDIETERQLIQGHLYHIRYPFADGSGSITIATTRPETMLADVAVAVHPLDQRYAGLIGKEIRLPLTDRVIPLIVDEYPDPEFGTGAVKITPAHDANDFEVGMRHGLPILFMLDEAGKVTDLGGKYAGLNRQEARKQVVADLEAGGHLVKIENHEIAVLVSERSKDVIEPLASEQWFVNQAELAKSAIRVVKEGQIRFHPERYEAVYLEWMENIRDWCISRQLWWGHRIPVYYTESGQAYAARSWEEAQVKAGDEKIVRQDDDVLDTWFSSGLWPFATLGWPQETEDLATYYPTSVLVTSREILYLWVARMIMMGMDFVGQIPFKDVYIYATVLTEDGKRMSKSLGTGVDPLEIIETKGADALRYTLFSQTGLNQDIRYSDRKTNDARNLCNKIWNASRFVLTAVGDERPRRPASLEPIDEWILSRLAACEAQASEAFETYDIQAGVQALYQFFWAEFCDWYLEISKPRLEEAKWTLLTCLEACLKMMHPVMPFITEEVYQLLPQEGRSEFLMASEWPEIDPSWRNLEVEGQVERWLEIVRGIRALRAEAGITPRQGLPEVALIGDLAGGEELIRSQAWIETIRSSRPEGRTLASVVAGVEILLPMDGLVDTAKERERIEKEIDRAAAELKKLEAQLANPDFRLKAKPEVVAKLEANVEAGRDKMSKLQERLSHLN